MQYKTDDVTLTDAGPAFPQQQERLFEPQHESIEDCKVLDSRPSEAADIPQKEARKEVRVQVADFNAYREARQRCRGEYARAGPERGHSSWQSHRSSADRGHRPGRAQGS
jgi:hypothetical protein